MTTLLFFSGLKALALTVLAIVILNFAFTGSIFALPRKKIYLYWIVICGFFASSFTAVIARSLIEEVGMSYLTLISVVGLSLWITTIMALRHLQRAQRAA